MQILTITDDMVVFTGSEQRPQSERKDKMQVMHCKRKLLSVGITYLIEMANHWI